MRRTNPNATSPFQTALACVRVNGPLSKDFITKGPVYPALCSLVALSKEKVSSERSYCSRELGARTSPGIGPRLLLSD